MQVRCRRRPADPSAPADRRRPAAVQLPLPAQLGHAGLARRLQYRADQGGLPAPGWVGRRSPALRLAGDTHPVLPGWRCSPGATRPPTPTPTPTPTPRLRLLPGWCTPWRILNPHHPLLPPPILLLQTTWRSTQTIWLSPSGTTWTPAGASQALHEPGAGCYPRGPTAQRPLPGPPAAGTARTSPWRCWWPTRPARRHTGCPRQTCWTWAAGSRGSRGASARRRATSRCGAGRCSDCAALLPAPAGRRPLCPPRPAPSFPPPQDRGRCLDQFARLYGGLPLRARALAGAHPRPWLLRLAPLAERLYAISRGHL
jgi:hypothetical protein